MTYVTSVCFFFQEERTIMKCPFCGHPDTSVIDSRPADDNSSIRRRRVCSACDKRFTTYEKVETIPLIIVKKDKAKTKACNQGNSFNIFFSNLTKFNPK